MKKKKIKHENVSDSFSLSFSRALSLASSLCALRRRGRVMQQALKVCRLSTKGAGSGSAGDVGRP